MTLVIYSNQPVFSKNGHEKENVQLGHSLRKHIWCDSIGVNLQKTTILLYHLLLPNQLQVCSALCLLCSDKSEVREIVVLKLLTKEHQDAHEFSTV